MVNSISHLVFREAYFVGGTPASRDAVLLEPLVCENCKVQEVHVTIIGSEVGGQGTGPRPIVRKPLAAKFNEVFPIDMTIAGEVGAEGATGKLAPGHNSTGAGKRQDYCGIAVYLFFEIYGHSEGDIVGGGEAVNRKQGYEDGPCAVISCDNRVRGQFEGEWFKGSTNQSRSGEIKSAAVKNQLMLGGVKCRTGYGLRGVGCIEGARNIGT